MPRTRLVHLGPTPRNERKISASHGSAPPWAVTTRHAIACICGALASRIRAIATSIAKGRLSVIGKPRSPLLYAVPHVRPQGTAAWLLLQFPDANVVPARRQQR